MKTMRGGTVHAAKKIVAAPKKSVRPTQEDVPLVRVQKKSLKPSNATVAKKKVKPVVLPATSSLKPRRRTAGTAAGSTEATAVSATRAPLSVSKPPVRSLAIRSPFRFPLDSMRVATQTARFGGVAFVVFGAIMTLFSMQHILQDMGGTTPFMSAATIDSLTEPSGDITTTSITPIPSTSIRIDQQSPVHDVVRVEVLTTTAYQVDIYAYSNGSQVKLRSAEQVGSDKWVAPWDTTTYENGSSYEIFAKVYYATGADPLITQVLPSVLVQNIDSSSGTSDSVASSTSDTNGGDAATSTSGLPPAQDAATLSPILYTMPANLTGVATIDVTVGDAKYVSLRAIEKATNISKRIDAKRSTVDPSKWQVVWDTAKYANGSYKVYMKVEYNTGEIIDAPYTYVTLTNLLTTAPITTDVPLDSTSVPVLSSDPVSTSVTNLKLYVSSGETMSGTEKVEAEIFGTNAEAIALYARSSAAVEPRFIGNMMKMQSSSKWSFNWYTNNTQNGSYYLFARAKTAAPTPLDSPSVPIKVFNEVAETVKTTESVTYEKEIVQATKSVATADGALAAIVVPEYVPADEGSAPVLQEAGIESSVSALLNDHQKEIDSLLLRLGTAKRANDAEAEKRVMKSVDDLAETIADAASEQTDADYDTVYKDVRTLLQTRIDAYLASIVTFNALLVERSRTNVLQDSDRDGVSDFDEVVIYKTDPYRADTDHDGYTDGAEIISGFDPLSAEAESVVAYESPKTSGAFREDLLSVDSIEPIQPEVAASSTATSSLTAVLIGRGLPNSFVTLYVFSTPVIVTVKTDADGAWRYRFDKELEDGEHNVYVGMTDNAGRIVAKSRPLTFIKEAQAITPVEATSIEALTAADREPSLVSEYILYAIVSISVVAIGLVLILLGIHLDAQRRRVDLVTSPV